MTPCYVNCYVAHPLPPGTRASNGRLPCENPGKTARFHLVCNPFRRRLFFLNNRWILHNRTAFEDHPGPELRRHLVRLWLRRAAG
jgi:hypothetical protein